MRAHPERVDMSVLAQFPEYIDFRNRKKEKQPDAASSWKWRRRQALPAYLAGTSLITWCVNCAYCRIYDCQAD